MEQSLHYPGCNSLFQSPEVSAYRALAPRQLRWKRVLRERLERAAGSMSPSDSAVLRIYFSQEFIETGGREGGREIYTAAIADTSIAQAGTFCP